MDTASDPFWRGPASSILAVAHDFKRLRSKLWREETMISRRAMVAGGALALAASGTLSRVARAAQPSFLPQGLPQGVYDTATLEPLPGKKPLIKLSYRPPNYETPLSHFTSEFTPNDSFFVRYHLAGIPEEIDAAQWKLKVGGEGVARPLELSVSDLRSGFDAVELAAVCQCAGNRRGFSEPHVAGVEWGFGAVGNALWRGVRLKDVLNRAGVRPETVEIVLNGADGPVLEGTPDFVKSIPVDKALDDNTLIAYEMNGAPLPHYNGFPIRLIVPGWTATYWMKHLDSIEAWTKPFAGFWMKGAYRIPTGEFPVVQHFLTQMTAANEPITEMVVNSMITAPAQGHTLRAAETAEVRGLAWDGGYGVRRVEISVDGGNTWREAALGKDVGRFAFRAFAFPFTPARAGKYQVLARASNSIGQTQAEKLIFNPAGYHNNVIRPLTINVL
jgi:DMSO/TMAO reductase YedYZ molybdopterin-dependent catalytic subunit